jgi:hypothetical protein
MVVSVAVWMNWNCVQNPAFGKIDLRQRRPEPPVGSSRQSRLLLPRLDLSDQLFHGVVNDLLAGAA